MIHRCEIAGRPLCIETQKYAKLITDLAVVDLDNDGTLELAFTSVVETDGIIDRAKSFLYTIDLQNDLAKNKTSKAETGM